MKILMIAADPMEFAGITARAKAMGPAAVPVQWSRLVELSGNTLLLAVNGAGSARAAAVTDAALADFPADAVISTGFCGALSPDLEIADVLVATEVKRGADVFPALGPTAAPEHRTGPVISIDHVARTAAEKRTLHERGGSVVEMEAAGVAERAQARGIGFYCIRVVSDLAGEDMANDFNAALRDDGHFDTINLLGQTLRKPLVRLPELIRLRNRCVRAASVLGEFIADCRF